MSFRIRTSFILSFIFAAKAWGQEAVVSEDPTTGGQAVQAVDAVQKMFASELSTAQKLLDMMMEFFVKYSFQVLGGLIVFGIGWWGAGLVAKFIEDLLKKKGVDVVVIKFLVSIIKIVLLAFAALMALGKFGITIAPFIAGLSVVGFGASFAVQGPLSNYAAGATLIFTKPFKVGDIVEVSDVMGTVVDMTLARTEMKTLDGTVIFIPNKQIIGEIIHNYSEYKKLDLNIGVSYSADVEKAISIIEKNVSSDDRIPDSPAPKIGISEFADSSVNIYARLWCKPGDYWDLTFDLNRKIFADFNSAGIEIPFPQRDIHIIKEDV